MHALTAALAGCDTDERVSRSDVRDPRYGDASAWGARVERAKRYRLISYSRSRNRVVKYSSFVSGAKVTFSESNTDLRPFRLLTISMCMAR